MSINFCILLSLIAYITRSYATDFYGGLTLSDDKTKLKTKGGSGDTVFSRTETSKDEWSRNVESDSSNYVHLDGAFFRKEDEDKVLMARVGYKRKGWKGLTDVTSQDAVTTSVVTNDLVNYNLYLFTGNTHSYDEVVHPWIASEQQGSLSCWMTAQNNAFQYEIWTKDKMQEELDRQWKIDLRMSEVYPEPKYVRQYKIGDDHSLPGEIAPKIRKALHFNHGVIMTNKETKRGKTTSVPRSGFGEEVDQKYLLDNQVVGYLIHLKFKGVWSHWVTIKYFGGKGWYPFDGASGAPQPDTAYDSFADAYKPIYDYWIGRGYVILVQQVYALTKDPEWTPPSDAAHSELQNEMDIDGFAAEREYNNLLADYEHDVAVEQAKARRTIARLQVEKRSVLRARQRVIQNRIQKRRAFS